MSIVRAPGLLPDGSVGVRGWRAHCCECGYLGEPKGFFGATSELRVHVCRRELPPAPTLVDDRRQEANP